MKGYRFKFLIIGLILGVLVLFSGYFIFGRDVNYYAVVLNDESTIIECNNGFKYQYVIMAYDSKGVGKRIKFSTSKKLRSGVYYEFRTNCFHYVCRLREVNQNEVPIKALKEITIFPDLISKIDRANFFEFTFNGQTGVIEDKNLVLEEIKRANRTKIRSVNDFPVKADEVIKLKFIMEDESYEIFIYKKKNKYYMERPYESIYLLSEESYSKIKDCVDKKD